MWNGGWHDAGGAWWIVMVIMMVAFWGGMIWFLVVVTRHGAAGGRPPESASRPTAHEILHDRLARGEIDVEEYRQRLDALPADGSG